MLNGAGNLVTQDMEKAEVLKNPFQVSLYWAGLQASGRPVGKSEVKKIFPWRKMIRLGNV